MPPKLPRNLYKNFHEQTIVSNESNENYILEGVSIGNGTWVHIKDAHFPYKNFVDAEILVAANSCKALFIETLKNLATWQGIISLCLFTPKRQALLDSFNRVSGKIMGTFILKDEYLSEFSRNLHIVIFFFLLKIGFEESSCEKFADVFVHLIEYDNAYRLRLEDIFSETTAEELSKRPIKTVLRLSKLLKEREKVYYPPVGSTPNDPSYFYPTASLQKKITAFTILLVSALIMPRIRKAFKSAILTTNFNKLQLDDIDLYWVAMRTDYLFQGKTHFERREAVDKKGWKYPVLVI